MCAMRDQLLVWDDPEEQELLLKVLVQQQRIMEVLCHQVSAIQLDAQELSGNAHTGSYEFLDTPGSSPRYRPNERESKSNEPEFRRPQVVVQADQPEQQQQQHAARGTSFIRSAFNTSQHPLNPQEDIDCKMADCWRFDIDLIANFLDQSPCTSNSNVSGVIPAPEHNQLVINKLDGRSGSCQKDDISVGDHTQHTPRPTHPGKNFAPAPNSVAVIQSSHGKLDNINKSLNRSPHTPGSFSEFSGDHREQAHDSSTGGEALRANNKINSSATKADAVSVLDNRANRCTGVQINNFPNRLLHNGSALDSTIFAKKPIEVSIISFSSQHNGGHRTPQSKYAVVSIHGTRLCTTTKVKLSHAAVFQPKGPEVCSTRSAVRMRFCLQQGFEFLQYEPWDPGVRCTG